MRVSRSAHNVFQLDSSNGPIELTYSVILCSKKYKREVVAEAAWWFAVLTLVASFVCQSVLKAITFQRIEVKG